MRKCFTFVVLLLLPGTLSADTIIGGEAGTLLQIMIDPGDVWQSLLDGVTSFQPSLTVTRPEFSFSVAASLSYRRDSMSAEPEIDRFALTVDPLDFIRIRIGRFHYRPGAAELFSPTDYFSSLDYESLLTGRFEKAMRPADIVQASLFAGNLFLTLTAAPYAGPHGIPDPTSPWLPRKDLPARISVAFPVQQDMFLKELIVEGEETVFSIERASGAVEVGASLAPLDASLLFYHGRDNSPLYQARFLFPQGLFQDYEIALTPVARVIDALGLNLTLVSGGLRFWLDTGYVFSKTFLSKRLSSDNFQTDLERSPLWEYAFGASWELDYPALLLLGQFRNAWVVNATADMIQALLQSALSLRLTLGLWDQRVRLQADVVLSTSDWSLCLVPAVAYAPSSELNVQLLAPLFLGQADSELGQFSANHLVSLGIAWRF